MLIGLILTLPLILYGLPFLSADGVYHVIYYRNFADQFWSGDLYPRWLSAMNGGLGGPTFFYYPPLTYYLASLLRPLAVSTWHQLGIAASLGLIISGLFAYLWLKEISAAKSALIAALLYMLLPYHLTYDLYGRGALAEFLAFIWMPLILYFVVRVIRGHQHAVVGLAVSYAMLIMTHLLTTLMFTAVPICYACYVAGTKRRMRVASLVIGAMSLGIGLSAVYVFPAMTTQDFVYIHEMKTGYLYYENWFLPMSLYIDGSLRYFWMIFQVGGLAFLAFFRGRSRLTGEHKRELSFWTVTVTCSIFMMLPLSKPIWEIAPTLQMLQFPWRFNTILSVASLPLLALAVSSVKPPYSRFTICTLVCMSFISLLWIYDVGRKTWQSFGTHAIPPELIDSRNGILKLNMDTHAFWPRCGPMEGATEFESLLQKIGYSGGELTKVRIVEGTGTVITDRWEPRDIALQVNTPTGVVLNVAQFYYPGWAAQLSGAPYRVPVRASERDGLVNISVPAGTHQLQLRLEQSPAEYMGQIISLICALITLFLLPLLMYVKTLNSSGSQSNAHAPDRQSA